MIKVKLICDSINTATQDRLTTYLLTYPRYIHAEVMTHRMFSRNAASSRAIPVTKFRQDVLNNPVVPTHWGANQKGMQAAEELDDTEAKFDWNELDVDGSLFKTTLTAREVARRTWLQGRDQMLELHRQFEEIGLHKQIANRVLEPWFHIDLLVSATEFGNYYGLRPHKDAHPDIQALADAMLFKYMTNQPDPKNPGEWHLPYGDREIPEGASLKDIKMICTARAARISYKTFDGVIDLEADKAIHDKLVASGHWSPFEHVAKALPQGTWSGNFRGWQQYRKEFPGENRNPDLAELWEERKKISAFARGEVGVA